MSKLDGLIQQKQQRKEQWKAQKGAEREQLNALTDQAILDATTKADSYLHYLDVQADNPRYSPSNVLLALAQKPDITLINSLKGWNELGRTVRLEEMGIKIRVSDTYIRNGREYRGYKIGLVFDVSQTIGKGAVPKLTIRENTPEMDTALGRLLDLSPVKVMTSDTTTQDACYDPATQTITVSNDLTDAQIFSALAREIVHAEVHNHGMFAYYSREEYSLHAESVSYMLCRSFGLQATQPDVSNLNYLYNEMEVQDRRGALDSLQQMFGKMQRRIQREILPQERKKEYARSGR